MKRALLPAAVLVFAIAVPAHADGRDEPSAEETFVQGVLRAFPTFDADGNGTLDKAEFPLEEAFARLDLDKDGTLTRGELEKVMAMAAKARRERAEKEKKDTPAPPPGKGAPDKAGKDAPKEKGGAGDDGMDPADGAMTVARARKIMESDPRWDAEARRAEFLRNFDRDPKDGVVAKKEYAGADVDSVFRKFDLNRNGELDDRELLILMKIQISELEKSRRRPDRGNFHYLFDLDRDNRVTREEYAILRGPANSFRDFDADDDGVVGYDEIRYPERYRGGMAGREAAAPAPENRNVWDLHDKDGDRRVSLEEFGGSEAVFRRLDRNGDGYLTPADA